MSMQSLGWSTYLDDQPRPSSEHHLPGRLVAQERHGFVVETAHGRRPAEPSGRLRRAHGDELPCVVGDWVDVAVAPNGGDDDVAHVVRVYERRSLLQRKVPGEAARPQLIAANVDVAFVVCSLNHELNPRRIERYLTGIWDSGARPVVVLNKLDLCDDVDAVRELLAPIALSTSVEFVSATTGEGLAALHEHLPAGATGVLVGSSGVGKSSLTNRMLGRAAQATQSVRAGDDKGRHTTTSKRLVQLEEGGLLIDTPGMREFALWSGDATSFEDLEALAAACRFSDCGHETEPGCAVRAAIDAGALDVARLESWRKLARELARIEARKDRGARAAERARQRSQSKLYRSVQKRKRDQRG